MSCSLWRLERLFICIHPKAEPPRELFNNIIQVQIGEPIPIGPYFTQFKVDRDEATQIVNKTIRLELLSMISGFERGPTAKNLKSKSTILS